MVWRKIRRLQNDNCQFGHKPLRRYLRCIFCIGMFYRAMTYRILARSKESKRRTAQLQVENEKCKKEAKEMASDYKELIDNFVQTHK